MVALTETEARLLYTALQSAWAPGHCYLEFKAAMVKLCKAGGGVCCRDCTDLGVIPSRFGGLVCKPHKEAENAMLTQGKAP